MRIVITGSNGQLGVELVPALAPHGEVIGTTHGDLDVTDPGCADRLAALRPDWVVHAAGATDVDGCEREPLSRIRSEKLDRPARRPAFAVLENAAWQVAGLPSLRAWPEALAAMLGALHAASGRIVD
jgi:dTDP-4-dehydrorhamnose reductase